MISEQRYRRKREEKYKFEQRLFVAQEERATRRYKNWFSFNQDLHAFQYYKMRLAIGSNSMISKIIIHNDIIFTSIKESLDKVAYHTDGKNDIFPFS